MTAHISLPQLHDSELDQRLGEEITLLAGQINAATHRLLTLIARFDERKARSGGGTVRSCAHWLNWKCGIALGAAREKVRVERNREDKAEREWLQARKLVHYQDDDGMWVIHARLPPETGSLVVQAIEAVTEPLRQAQWAARLKCRDPDPEAAPTAASWKRASGSAPVPPAVWPATPAWSLFSRVAPGRYSTTGRRDLRLRLGRGWFVAAKTGRGVSEG